MSNVESTIKPERYAILGLVYKRLTELGFKNPHRVKERFKEYNQELRYVIVIKGFEPNINRLKKLQNNHCRLIQIDPACETSFYKAALKLAGIYRNHYKYKRKDVLEAEIYTKIVQSILRNNKHLSLEGEAVQDEE